MAFDFGVGHDMSTPFVAFTLDNQGNPYIAFDTQAPTQNPATCFSDSRRHRPERQDLRLQHVRGLVARRRQHLGRRGGSPPAPAAAKAYRANPASETGTDVFPTIAAGDPARSTSATSTRIPSCRPRRWASSCRAGARAPTNFPARCHWNVETSQSLNLSNTPATATFTKVQATTTPMHYGDICNLGIASARRPPRTRATCSTSTRRRWTRRPAARTSCTRTTTRARRTATQAPRARSATTSSRRTRSTGRRSSARTSAGRR